MALIRVTGGVRTQGGLVATSPDPIYTLILPQTAVGLSTGPAQDWGSTANVVEGTSTDSNYAETTVSNDNASERLRQTNYGMSILNSDIDTLTVTVKGHRTASNFGNMFIRLVLDGSAITGEKSVSTPASAVDTVFSGDDAYWGTTLTKELLSDSGFGVEVRFNNTTSNNNGRFRIYYSKISVTYV